MNLSDTIITTERLKLVPVSEKSADTIFQEFTPEITTYMFPKPPETIKDTLAFITMAHGQLLRGESLHVAILKQDTEELLGGGGINNIHTPTPSFGIWIKKSAHGHKYGREAIAGLKEWAKKNVTYDYLIYPVDKRNTASRKIAESLGGVIKKEYEKTNEAGKTLELVEYWIDKPSI